MKRRFKKQVAAQSQKIARQPGLFYESGLLRRFTPRNDEAFSNLAINVMLLQ